MAQSNAKRLLQLSSYPTAALPGNASPAVSLASGDNLTPDDKLTLRRYRLSNGAAVEARFVHPQNLARDAHTLSEHHVYETLWRAAGGQENDAAAYRDVTIGQKAIARQARISKRNLIRILQTLHEKLSIETLQTQVSSDHTAKTYRVWGIQEILSRRRTHGYVWVYRNRNAVKQATIMRTADASSQIEEPARAILGSPERAK